MHSISVAIRLAFLLIVLSACTSQDLEEGDGDLVLRIEQLESYGLTLPDDFRSHESLERERWFDGSFMITYEYQSPSGLPSLYSTAERHLSNSDACDSFSSVNFGLSLGLGDDELSIRDDLFRYGDKSRFGLVMADGQPVGNYFAMCQANRSFMVLLAGIYFDDGKQWGQLIGPTLDAVSRMD